MKWLEEEKKWSGVEAYDNTVSDAGNEGEDGPGEYVPWWETGVWGGRC